METDLEPDMTVIPDNMTSGDFEELIGCVNEVIRNIVNAEYLLVSDWKTYLLVSWFSQCQKNIINIKYSLVSDSQC